MRIFKRTNFLGFFAALGVMVAASCACTGEKKSDVSATATKSADAVNAETLTGSGCIRTGCSGNVCTEAGNSGMVSTCEWREEYACYKTAKCEKQASGQCGWTPSESLQSCLKAAGVR